MYHAVVATTRYRSFEEALSRDPGAVAAHAAHLAAMHARGQVLMAGIFLDGREPLQTMAICTTRAVAEEYIDGDPFTHMGMVEEWSIREWADMFASPGTDA